VRDSLTILRKQIWYALLFFALVVAGVAVWTFRQVPLYEATASIIIDPQPPRVFSQLREVVELGTGSFWANKEYYETQYKVLASRDLAEKVVEALQLESSPSFLGLERIRDPQERLAAQERANPVSIVRGGLAVQPVQDSRVVRLVYRHPVPAHAQEVVNTLAKVYQKANIEYRSVATVGATRDLNTQFRELKKKLEEAEDRLAQFKQKNGIIVANVEAQLGIITEELQSLSATISNLLSERERLEARLARIRGMNLDQDWGSLDEAFASPLLTQLKQTYLRLSQEKIELSIDLMEKHPRVRTAEEQLALVKKSIDGEVRGIVAGMERNLAALQDTESAHRARLRRIEAEARRLEALNTEFTRLTREAEENRNLYEMVVTRLRETSLTGQIEVNNIRLLDLALLPKAPSTPRTTLNLTMAILLGLLGGIAFAFLVEFLDRSIRTREDVEALGIPFLGIAPDVAESERKRSGSPDLYVADHPRSSAAECVRLVRTNLLFALPGREVRKLVVTSASPKEGKTHTALNLAISMALSNQKTLLIDSDMRRPRLNKVFGTSEAAGLSNLCVGKAEIDDVVQKTAIENLFLLPSGPIPPNPAELLQTEQFLGTLDAISRKFDKLIFDSPPIMAVADPLILSRFVDGVILVVRSGVSSRDVVFRGVQALSDVQARVLGAVLNGVDITKPYYGRYYQYYRRGYGQESHDADPGTPEVDD
jgi:capsular exopolysaccharide synthesis family protein